MKKSLVSFGILLSVCFIFFWPIFKGFMPFPGDLLMDSNPYRSQSFMGYAPGAYPNKAQDNDVISEMYPWKYFSIQEWKQGKVAFWNPHNFSGNSLMQNLQSAVFNPFNVVFFLVPFTTGWTIFILIQPILAMLFFYMFARKLQLSRFASVVGAIGFAFSSYMTVWVEYGNVSETFAYLPLLLFFLILFLQKERIFYYIGFILATVLMLLSGYIQGAFYCIFVSLLFTIYYFIHVKKIPSKKTSLSLFAMFSLPILLCGFQYYPTFQLFLNSTRWPYSLSQVQNLLNPVWYWITLFASDFFGNPATRNYYLPITYIERVAYIGIPLFIFALLGIQSKKLGRSFFLFLALVVGILTTNIPGVAFLYLLPLPVINTTVPTRFLSVFMFAGVVLACFGIDWFYKKKIFPKKLSIIFVGIYALLWVGILVGKHIYPDFSRQIAITEHNLVIPTILALSTIVIFAIAIRFQRISQTLLLCLVIVDLFYVFQKITPFAPAQSAFPSNPVTKFIRAHAGINRYWGYGSGYVEPNFQTVFGTYSPEGNDPLHINTYGNLLASSFDGKIPQFPPRPDANLAPGYGPNGMNNHYRQTLLNLLGVKFITQYDEMRPENSPDYQTFSQDTYQLVWSQHPWQIYQNKKALPRYFLVNKYVVVHKPQAQLDALYSIDPSKVLILTTSPTSPISPTAEGTVKLLKYETQYISFKTDTTGPMLLFISDTYGASWRVEVDQTPSTLQIADFSFREVVVPKGKHTIVMFYSGQAFRIGIITSILAIITCVISVVVLKKYE